MTARFPLIPAATRSGSHRIAAAVAIVFAGAFSIPGAAYAQTTAAGAAAASAPAGAASGGTQFTVQPGQSLNDAAVAMTQSHDRAVLARAAKAIFDANPNAFMGHDPSRLRLGAVLNLPAVDATGAPIGAASAAMAASAASGATAQAAITNNASATTSASAPAATAAGASAATTGASSPAEAAATSPTQGASAPATAEATSAPATGALPTSGAAAASASGASGTHSYTGSIQGSESAATPPGASATSNAQPASQPRPSSLQQLLALKNRVLMELQKHGIGKQPGANENAPTAPGATQSSNATPGAGAPAHAGPAATQPANQPMGISQEYLGVAAIVGAGLVALLAGLAMRRRRKAARAQEAAKDDVAREDETPVAPAAVEPVAVARSNEPHLSLQEPSEIAPREAGPAAAISPAFDHDAAPKPEPETFDSASAEAALDAASTLGADALPRESLDLAREEARAAEAAEREQAAREQELTTSELVADTPSAELPLDEQPIHEPVEPHFAEPIEAPHDESGAKPKPFTLDLGATPGAGQHEPTFEQPTASVAPPIQLSHVEPAAQHEQLIEPLPELNELHPADAEDAAEQRAPTSLPLGAPPPLEPAVPDAFPRDAMRALDSIDDFALPPRVERSATDAPAVTQPVVAPEITAQQAVPAHAPQAPAVADEIIAGTAGAAAVAGLGAARFGALKLDFDLELPPSPSQVVPAFTPVEVARIARNKLDLAVEYIDLGDVVGARTLINEVIESNDADTRADARALLSTLAPLS
ncbi:FimV C-terminal domain-containing protein [Paraburkholderia steynii]|uniref:FimV C-terminal domain-containing protein n=1 Tax=Paraburkholderia steynii TaxID=1245441 RepID=A0A7Z7FK83_9BURK|nr:FimV/HubP family polar landmark protein [Paraburkholderia steynii]SDI78151.1 FimV C-terminal domain-containing protein [Paraburkholderia steynii]